MNPGCILGDEGAEFCALEGTEALLLLMFA